MDIPTCDMCHRPATFFYHYATCSVGGGPAETAQKSVSLCAEHAADYARKECQRSLEDLLKSLEKSAKLAKPDRGICFNLVAKDEKSARDFGRAILQLCGGEVSVLSPETVSENQRRVAVKLYGVNAPEIPAAETWEIQWNSDPTTSVLDQWQTGGWSRRLDDLIVAQGCELRGWGIEPGKS